MAILFLESLTLNINHSPESYMESIGWSVPMELSQATCTTKQLPNLGGWRASKVTISWVVSPPVVRKRKSKLALPFPRDLAVGKIRSEYKTPLTAGQSSPYLEIKAKRSAGGTTAKEPFRLWG